ncbi:MAG TPA: glycoside hydrolase family 78 protein [Caproiciproducens sp.]|nr:glycoside hydrolase family 78 protein [Caproiciproducens sp.]
MDLMSTVKIVHLTTEHRINPVGIDIKIPRLSWETRSSDRNVFQNAYQILVALSEDDLQRNRPVWNSGKVISEQSIDCAYEGPAPESRQRYYWKVRIWVQNGNVSDWSEPAFWETGLLSKSDWKAQWVEPDLPPIEAERYSLAELMGMQQTGKMSEIKHTLRPCPMLRGTFSADKKVKRARLYATAHGVYRLELNGKRVGDSDFAPDFTPYDSILQYQTYDVTELILNGENAVGAVIGVGWYAGNIGITGDNCQYGDRPAFLMQLAIEYQDGSEQLVVSDRSFRFADGPWQYSDIFVGEKYDARLEQEGWSRPGFDDSGWEPVRTADYGYGNLVAQYGDSVLKVDEIAPADVLTTPKGETLLDFGQVIAGRVVMRVFGSAGTTVTLEHAEILDDDGSYLFNIRGLHKDQKDIYVLKGGCEEVYEPCFTFHGFRYVRITGYPGTVKAENFTAVVLSSLTDKTGSFECSDERLNRLQKNIQWSQLANMISIPTDCPQRERAGWTGDIQVFAPTACYNMDVQSFLTRWLRAVAVEQTPDGQVPIVVPFIQSFREISNSSFGAISSSGWGDACIIVPWALYLAYGDTGVLRENYDTMVKWVAYIQKTAEENIPDELKGQLTPEQRERQKYLWNTGFHFGDWLLPSLSGDLKTMNGAFATKELVSTCFYAYSAGLLAKIAEVLGKEDDRRRYSELNVEIRRAYAEEYLSPDGRLSSHYQGVYVLALQFNMIPEEMRPKVLGQLVKMIRDNGNRLDTGFLSVPFLLDVLYENGRKDVAFDLLYQNKCPSWLFEVEQGATTIWEAWNNRTPDGGIASTSYNHYAFGCVGDWMYRVLAGLRADAPAYKHFLVRPELDCGLTFVKASHHSPFGDICVKWVRTDEKVHMEITVPVSTTATVTLPKARLNHATEHGHPLNGTEGIRSACQKGEDTVLEVTSGSYVFEYGAL